MKTVRPFLHHAAGECQAKHARRLLLEYSQTCERTHDAIERILVDAGFVGQCADRLRAVRQVSGNVELEDRLQRGCGHVARTDLKQQLRGSRLRRWSLRGI